MIRKLILVAALCAGAFVSGCVTSPYPSSYSLPPRVMPPPAMRNYANAPRAPLLGELQACNAYGANLGLVSETGASLDYTPYIYTAAGPLLRAPVEGACLSSGFGFRGAAEGGGREHTGIDLAKAGGSYIFAAGNAEVYDAGLRGGYGYVVELDHGAGVHTIYAHLAEINPAVTRGAHVTAGEAIGFMGMTGNATGVHLHYEVIIDGLKVDPLHYGMQSPVG
jgi:murein DD-endopeptidase MepM/ murein hydrolase activator NlpD